MMVTRRDVFKLFAGAVAVQSVGDDCLAAFDDSRPLLGSISISGPFQRLGYYKQWGILARATINGDDYYFTDIFCGDAEDVDFAEFKIRALKSFSRIKERLDKQARIGTIET